MAIDAARHLSSVESFDGWEDKVCKTFVPLHAHRATERDFIGNVQACELGAVVLSRVDATAAIVERTPRLIRHADPEYYKLGVQVSGTCVVEQDGRQALLGAGDIAIYDTSRPYRLAFDDSFSMLVAMFPRNLVRLSMDQMAPLTAVRLAGDRGIGSLISPLMHGLARDIDTTGTEIAAHLGDAILDLVTAAFSEQLGQANADSRGAHRILSMKIRRFIDENLGDPGLSPTKIAAAHFISVRHLQKLFEEEGGSVSTWMRSRRLERCRRDLADPGLQHHTIASIGARWGLLDPAHFSRLFKAAYASTPREYRLTRSF